MIAVIAKLNVTPGREADFETAMLALAAQVRENEPGNQLYTLCRDADGNYLMMELYDSEDDLAAHGQTEHIKASGASFAGLMSGRPEIQRLQVIG